jgi:hypothetical protein
MLNQHDTIPGKVLSRLLLVAAMLLMTVCAVDQVRAQESNNADYMALYEKGDYTRAFDEINKRLTAIYDARVDNKRIPTDYISAKRLEERTDLVTIFRKRKAEGFFIERHNDLHELHLYAARCNDHLEHYERSLNHYVQCMRFKEVEPGKDDVIAYEMGHVFKKLGYAHAHEVFLQEAYALNPSRYEYSLEIGRALYNTPEKKKAAYHLERYCESRGDALEDPSIYLMLAGLNEELKQYLKTAGYYKKYLKRKPDDGSVNFALGYIAYSRIGDYELAGRCFDVALKKLSAEDIYRCSKAYEYKGDMAMSDLEFEKAISCYLETVKYQQKVKESISAEMSEVKIMKDRVKDIKSEIIKNGGYDKYAEYEHLEDERGKKELSLREISYQYGKLDAGKVRWNLALSYERLERLQEAITSYMECISFDYNSIAARDRIVKLKLKINRGY